MPSYSKSIKIPGVKSADLYKVVSKEIDGFMKKTPVKSYKLHHDEAKAQVKLESSFMNATLHCENECLRLEGSLSFLAMPFKSNIDQGLEKWVSKAFKKS